MFRSPPRLLGILLWVSLLLLSCTVQAAPLQEGLFAILKPSGMMGSSPLYPKFTVADSSDPWAKKLHDTIQSDPRIQEVLRRYQAAQTETMTRYRAQLAREGKSPAEIERLCAARATPIYFVLKDGSGTPCMESGSAFIETWRNGKLETDFQYVCPKVKVTSGWEGFPKDRAAPFTDTQKAEFLSLVAHETSHAIMKETYGYIPKSINPWAAFGHWEGKMTSPQLAFTEGYAEFMGAWYSGNQDYSESKYAVDMDREMGLPKTAAENKKTEGVIACILWDIAKGESGIKGGMDKIHRVLREKKPWTIDGFAKGFKELFPSDGPAIDAILKQNLVPEKERLATCWITLNSERANVAALEKALADISIWKNPIAKAKTQWQLMQARRSYQKWLKRYQTIYGYTLAELTSKEFPGKRPSQAVPAPPPPASATISGAKPVTVDKNSASPFGE